MQLKSFISTLIAGTILFVSCSKDDPDPAPPGNDPCEGKTITVSATSTAATNCGSAGSITISAIGGTGFTYKVSAAGTYQASPVFQNVAAGSYTVFAKDVDGCEKSSAVSVASGGSAGPLFTNVRNLMTVKCQPCHNNSIQNGGMNWEVDCNIVANKARIKVRAVDIGDMPFGGPSLSQAEKDIITNWINAGGGYTN